MKQRAILLTLALLLLTLLVFQSAAAMASPNYNVEWFVPLTGTGGTASSANFAVQYTVGQTVTGYSASANYSTGLGFWAAVWTWLVHLPLLFK